MFNPYHKLFFSNGYGYVNDDQEPFPAVSEPTLAIWMANMTADEGSPYAAGMQPGEIGAGPRGSNNAWWFDAFGASFGCPYDGPNECYLDVVGYTWYDPNSIEQPAPTERFLIPKCQGGFSPKDCQLHYVRFGANYTGLSGIQFMFWISAPYPQKWQMLQPFLMDNLQLGWSNNSCEAGLLRITQRK